MWINVFKVKRVVRDESESELRFLWCWRAIFEKWHVVWVAVYCLQRMDSGHIYCLTNLLEHRINRDFLSNCSDPLLPPWWRSGTSILVHNSREWCQSLVLVAAVSHSRNAFCHRTLALLSALQWLPHAYKSNKGLWSKPRCWEREKRDLSWQIL